MNYENDTYIFRLFIGGEVLCNRNKLQKETSS